jgi:MoCo/4Fe-4S cofactor protein with predicted Tat translocation signal
MSKTYWKGVEELRNDAEFVRLKNNEFAEHLPLEEILNDKAASSDTTPRRDFLKFLGFSVAAASLAACETPVKKTIPYLIKPDTITPGVANWFASTFFDGYDYASILVKTREGRPIKIEGNAASSVTLGGTNARIQASVLSLYDNARLRHPLANGAEASWSNIDKEVTSKLAEIAAAGGKIRILSSTVISPSTKKVIADFTAKYPTTRHIQYDAVSFSGTLDANKESFGMAVLPSWHLDKADVIVSFDSDFLINGYSPVEHARQYALGRKLDDKKTMSRHFQFESALSLTGSNADYRYQVKPSQQGAAIVALYNAVAAKAGAAAVNAAGTAPHQKEISAIADQLWEHRGRSLVTCGMNSKHLQVLVNGINSMLGNIGTTLDFDNPSYLRQGSDADLAGLLDEMKKGEVGALFVYQCNPAYTLPNGAEFAAMMKNVKLSVSFADREDETAARCTHVCPDHHALESWNDAEPRKGCFSLAQPTIAPLFATRQAQESLLVWAGNTTPYRDYVQQYWSASVHPMQPGLGFFQSFWNATLQQGVFEAAAASPKNYSSAANHGAAAAAVAAMSGSGFEMTLYEKAGLGNGNQANNPWLQELPDPVSKITWDNYLCVAPADAREKGWNQGNVVEVKAGNVTAKLPVVVQPGQMPGTVSVALGYGRKGIGKVAEDVGVNVYPFAALSDGYVRYGASGITISKTTDDDHPLAATQTHHTMMGRAIVKETVLGAFVANPAAGNEEELFGVRKGKEETKQKPDEVNLWDNHNVGNHHWGMSIDLNSCIGCGSCVVSCQAENNVPVVGKQEVMNSREMHWIRIDRYYTSDADPKEHEKGDIKAMEHPSDNPSVRFQPVMCQHCAHAPCETVCPVIATSHSSEGMNQMIYNRCVGTRYCANNCPYKVRRFNWFRYSDNPKFDFEMNNDLGKMVLNPDVTVRSRGVMEKCSLCVQRIQDGKLTAKREGRTVADGEINTACAQSCPTQAITFGDYKLSGSRLSKMWQPEGRSYHLLGELDVQPNVFYQTKVRNIEGGHEA